MQKDHSQRLAHAALRSASHAALRSAPLTCRNAPAARDRGLGCVVPADVVGVGVDELGKKGGEWRSTLRVRRVPKRVQIALCVSEKVAVASPVRAAQYRHCDFATRK